MLQRLEVETSFRAGRKGRIPDIAQRICGLFEVQSWPGKGWRRNPPDQTRSRHGRLPTTTEAVPAHCPPPDTRHETFAVSCDGSSGHAWTETFQARPLSLTPRAWQTSVNTLQAGR